MGSSCSRSPTRPGNSCMPRAVDERREEQQRLLELARQYVRELSRRLPLRAAAVVGSVARGDFNVWSDVDVVVVADELPDDPAERTGLLLSGAPASVQPVGFTPRELEAGLARRNRMLLELADRGVMLAGEGWLRGRLAEQTNPLP